MVLAVVGVIAITLVGLCVWRFTPTREVRATTPIVCGALRLEVREVVESSGREVLHVGERFWEDRKSVV